MYPLQYNKKTVIGMTNVHMSNGASNSWVGEEFTSHLVEQIAVMVQKENASYLCVDYLGELPKSNGYLIDEGWRQRAAEWMFKGKNTIWYAFQNTHEYYCTEPPTHITLII